MSSFNSIMILAKDINIDRDYNNVLDYSTTNMLALLRSQSHLVSETNNNSFIRNNGMVQTSQSYETCLGANYLAFRNPDYTGKWFFAWIDDVKYKGDKCTEIYFTIDSWTTWFDNWTAKKCFIVRQHVNDDTIGANTLPENLDVGEVMQSDYGEILMGVPDPVLPDEDLYYFAFDCTYNPITQEDFKGTKKINGNIFGHNIFCFNTLSYVRNFIDDLTGQGKIDSLLNMYILPKALVDGIGTTRQHKGSTVGDYYLDVLNSSNSSYTETKTFNKNYTFRGITIKNNKCFCYPYNYMLVSNNVGNNIILKYEDFTTTDVEFELEMAVSIGASVRLTPKSYKGITKNYNESLPLAKYPTASWASDAYTNWLTANAVNVATSLIGAGVNAYAGNYSGTAGSIANLIGQFRQASLLPSITGGNNNGDVNFASKCNKFSIYFMRAKNEYMQIIDDYFTRYGYAIKKLDTPNITGRTYWNYVEIGQTEEIGYGSVPNKYMEDINNACRKGVTIWHSHENVGNWNLNNTIVS